MTDHPPAAARRLNRTLRDDGMLELRIDRVALPAPRPGEILVRMEAAPLNPSDLGPLLLAADAGRAERSGDAVLLPVPEPARPMVASRLPFLPPPGTEGAGTVIAAGDDAGRAWIGRRVAAFGTGLYDSHRVLSRDAVTLLPEGTSARDGAAISVNPLTALAMVEVMRRDGARALVHTAAASSLGRILQRVCAADGIPLVNIVRRPEQAALLRELGATHVLDSTDPEFAARMVATFAELDATIAFDAVGGGGLAGALLTAMEAAQLQRAGVASLYGSPVRKHVYVYGRLDPSPVLVPATVGMAWGVGGFLLPHFLAEAGGEVATRMAARVLDGLATTFATDYAAEIGLDALLDPQVLQRAVAKSTGGKILLCPNG